MSRPSRSHALAALTGLLCLPAACGMESLPEGGEPSAVEVESSEILNGSALSANYSYAAVFHKIIAENPARGYHWFGRPCSGTVLRQGGGYTWVLTARHCAGRNEGFDGLYDQVIPANDFRVTTRNPGALTWAKQSVTVEPLVSSTQASVYWIVPVPAGTDRYDPSYDMAVIRLPAELGALNPRLLAVDPGPLPAANTMMRAYGYGRNVEIADHSDEPELTGVDTGAGILRGAYDFPFGGPDRNGYTVFNTGRFPGNSKIISGDSGGPTTRVRVFTTGTTPVITHAWEMLVGVHSWKDDTYEHDSSVSFNWDWLMDKMSYVFVSPFAGNSQNLGLNVSTPATGARLALQSGDQSNTRWVYNKGTKELRIHSTSLCLDGTTPSAPKVQACNGSNLQKWEITSRTEIKNAGSGKCLVWSSSPYLSTCAGNYTTAWAWHFQP